ncbi:MAG: phosphoenolpyruvate--protein phosphotransferase [Desulfuromonas sp.]|nr:phosphoenolpyruvate--protein phosphotransferase [Desulfuromonas sp.]
MTNLAKSKQSLQFKGVAASPGIAIGEVYLLDRQRVAVVEYEIEAEDISVETERFHAAIELSRQQLRDIQAQLSHHAQAEHFYIIDTQLMILDDQMLLSGTTQLISEQRINASGALKRVLRQFRQSFDCIEDEYLRERGSDIELVGERILRNIRGKVQQQITSLERKSIVVAHDLSPADTLQMDKKQIVGFVTDLGGRTSHTAILARSLGIPAVVGLENITDQVTSGTAIIIDGSSGIIILDPDSDTLQEYLEKKRRYEFYQQHLQTFCELPAQTIDGVKINLQANLELPDEAEMALVNGATGIGLLRTEFMYMSRSEPPSEQDQFEGYRSLVEKIAPHPVTIRTLDVGGDKFVADISLLDEANPAMGLRSIRLSLHEKTLFKIQLRAILRASAYGCVRLMFPMITGVAEVRACKEMLNQVKDELRGEDIAFDEQLAVGIMIETPSAVFLADLLAREVDFFSVGTNDLIQYCLAVDRGNEHVAYLYEPFHPTILRALKRVVDAARQAGIKACICGEMASEPMSSLVLLAMGYTELSMNSCGISRVKKLLRQWNAADGNELLEQLLQRSTATEVMNYLESAMRHHFPDAQVDLDF